MSVTGKTIGRFKIIGEIGRGGMGVVYKAIQISLNRTVALKMLPTQMALSQEFRERFEREARILARLNHKNIVHIYDLEELKGAYFIVMEYIEGESLAKIIASRAPLPTSFIKKVAMGVTSALSAAHKAGIIHRDIKPENVMIDSYGEVKVMDFGIARAADQTCKTRSGIRLGTPEYMSPEQAKGLQVGPPSDLYSLGIVLYEMACGKVPFTGEDSLGIALKHIQEEPAPPSSLNPRIDADLEKVILKSLEKEPSSRYGDADELYKALDRIAVPEEEGEEGREEHDKEPLRFLYCPSCGASLKEESLRCPECGLVVRRQCPYCLEVFDAIYQVCPHCSRELPVLRPEAVPKTIVEETSIARSSAAERGKEQPFQVPSALAAKETWQRARTFFRRQKKWLLLGVGSLAGVVLALVLLSGGKKPPPPFAPPMGSSEASSTILKTPPSVPPEQTPSLKLDTPPGPAEVQEMLSRAQEYFDVGAFDLCIEQCGEILRWNADESRARSLIQKSEGAKPKVAQYLNAAQKALQEGRYQDCLKECEKILAISPKHTQGLNLLSLAKAQVSVPTGSVSGAPAEKKESLPEDPEYVSIQNIIERQKRAMETENIALLLQDIAAELQQQILQDAQAFFAQNKVLKVIFSKIKVQIFGAEAHVSLVSTITYSPVGSEEATTQSSVASWQLKKINGVWKITSF